MPKEPTRQQVHENLKRAYGILQEWGWVKGRMYAHNGVCSRGALAAASVGAHNVETIHRRYQPDQLGLVRRCEDELCVGLPVVSIVPWNDDSETTYEMVLRRFEEAIEKTRPLFTGERHPLTEAAKEVYRQSDRPKVLIH